MDYRIKPLDGLRALAAFGIVWIHSWIFTGTPSLIVFNIDFYRVIAIAGNGVSFFFVISGFFMYLVLCKKSFSMGHYLEFIINRWKRIAPAYYVSAVVYAVYFFLENARFPFFKLLLIDFTFLNNLFPEGNIISPYWSLGTEWHFYLLLPFLFIFNEKKKMLQALFFFALLSFLFLLGMFSGLLNEVFWRAQMPPRFIEFAWGVLAAYLFKNKIALPGWMKSLKGIIFSMIVTYAGRILMVGEINEIFGASGWVARAFAEPVMTFGFAWFMYLMVVEKSRLSDFLSKPFFGYLGKLSYSVYLWHAAILLLLGQIKFMAGTVHWFNTILVFLITAGFTILIAHFSYKFLEAPYFRSKKV